MSTIKYPTYNQIDQIKQLNNKYLINNLTDAQMLNGFIRIEYNRDDLHQIITNKEIVIATDNNKVIGYYLVGRKSMKAILNYQKDKAYTLSEFEVIPFDKIGYGCQVCIDEAYRYNGLFGKMLIALTDAIKPKYDYLLCSVSEGNKVSLDKHTRNGWQLIDSSETTMFFIYKTANKQLIK